MARTNEEALKALNAAEAAWASENIPMSKSAEASLPLPTSGTATIPAGIAAVIAMTTTNPNVAEGEEARRGNYGLLTNEGDQIPLSFFTQRSYATKQGQYAINDLLSRANLKGVRLVTIPTESGKSYKGFNVPVKVTFKTAPTAWTGSWNADKRVIDANRERQNFIILDVEPA